MVWWAGVGEDGVAGFGVDEDGCSLADVAGVDEPGVWWWWVGWFGALDDGGECGGGGDEGEDELFWGFGFVGWLLWGFGLCFWWGEPEGGCEGSPGCEGGEGDGGWCCSEGDGWVWECVDGVCGGQDPV